MKYILWLVGLMGLSGATVFAQQKDTVILTVNNRPIHKSEFEISYKKNNDLTDNSKESFDAFLQSYIDYQLAVEEAYFQKLDTMSDFRYQRSVFRSSAAAPYMAESTAINEAYAERLMRYQLEDVEVNHTLIPFEKKELLPADTLVAYKKAMKVYSELKKTEFVGNGYTDNSKSKSVVYDRESLSGYLGWVTPSMFSAKIVEAIYSLSLNEISKPIRTKRGYHIVQVLGKRPAVGQLKVDHIYFAFPQIPASKAIVDSVSAVVNELLSSAEVNFDALCEAYAEAYDLGDKGCGFDPFGLDAKLPVSLINEAYRIKEVGLLSRPVVTDMGVHLVRLVEKIPLADNVDRLDEVKKLMGEKEWWYYMTLENQKALFKKYNLNINDKAYHKLNVLAEKVSPIDSSFVSFISNRDDVLFVIEDTVEVKVDSFAKYLLDKVKSVKEGSYEEAFAEFFGLKSDEPFALSTERLEWAFMQFAIRNLHNHIYASLEKRYPEFKSKVDEFSGGLLAYEIKSLFKFH